MQENNCGFYTQAHSQINGFGAWHYLISSPIGDFHIVEWEGEGHEILRKIYENDNDAAVKKYNAVCKKLLRFAL